MESKDGGPAFPAREERAFDRWWDADGRFYDPDTEDVPWYDKRKELAAYTWMHAKRLAARAAASRARRYGGK